MARATTSPGHFEHCSQLSDVGGGGIVYGRGILGPGGRPEMLRTVGWVRRGTAALQHVSIQDNRKQKLTETEIEVQLF